MTKLVIHNEDGTSYLADPARARPWRWLKRLLILVVVAPFALLLLYKLPFVHPVSTLMVKDLVLLKGYERQWVPLDDIAPVLVNSVMMSEDGQFCSHSGIDWNQMKLVLSAEGEPSRGASTIPMQTVKNLFLWNGRSYTRKALELPLAQAASLILSKHRIMEIYLNIVEWGDGIYGVEAAAQHYFKRPASKLNARQAAYLAVTLPNPILRDASKPSRGMVRIGRIIERRAQNSGAYVWCVQ
ncbi:monofunctional biosynthetic peptidoglycan transglycosylase [Pseudochrobactrum sp. MP213Fo]|uniref:monofunctional biosynthetic peptidoglycan transglycosylase n=1 Tax=Pseudochrobactrum sp. MP213Fo TaxID=3022250 RepID=UPI003B9E7570